MTFPETFAKLHRTYENKAMRMLLKEFKAFGKKIPYEVLTPENAEAVIKLTLKEARLEKALFKIHLTIGKSYGNLEARRYRKYKRQKYTKNAEIEQEITQEENKTDEEWLLLLLIFLRNHNREFGGITAALITDTYVATIIAEIAKLSNVSLQEMRARIMKIVNKPSFYKWQVLRIVRMETTFAMNSAATANAEASGLEMLKRWHTRLDNRVRNTHVHMEQKTIPIQELFVLPTGVKMRYPCDKYAIGRPKDVFKELINCRCGVQYFFKD